MLIHINTSRGENQKGVSDMFGQMEIYVSNEALRELFLLEKVLICIHKCTDIYYKQ